MTMKISGDLEMEQGAKVKIAGVEVLSEEAPGGGGGGGASSLPPPNVIKIIAGRYVEPTSVDFIFKNTTAGSLAYEYKGVVTDVDGQQIHSASLDSAYGLTAQPLYIYALDAANLVQADVITKLEISAMSISELHINTIPLESLDLITTGALSNIDLSGQESLDFIKLQCENLETIDFSELPTDMEYIEIRYCNAITELELSDKNIVNHFNVQDNANLESITISNITEVQGVNISNCPNLTSVSLTDVVAIGNVSNGSGYVIAVYLNGNGLDIDTLNQLMDDLPDAVSLGGDYGNGKLQIMNNPGSAGCDVTIAQNKGWEVTN
jgi:hypothetical protein